jgi:hypothetical protein
MGGIRGGVGPVRYYVIACRYVVVVDGEESRNTRDWSWTKSGDEALKGCFETHRQKDDVLPLTSHPLGSFQHHFSMRLR